MELDRSANAFTNHVPNMRTQKLNWYQMVNHNRKGSRLQRLSIAGDQVEHAAAAELAAHGGRQVEHFAEDRVHHQRSQLVPCHAAPACI